MKKLKKTMMLVVVALVLSLLIGSKETFATNNKEKFTDYSLKKSIGIEMELPSDLTITKVLEVSPIDNNAQNKKGYKITNSKDLIIKMHPYTTNEKTTAMSALESYMATNVGAPVINDKKEFVENGLDIAQIGIIPFDNGEENYIAAYTAIKKQSRVIILATAYTSSSQNNRSLDFNNSENARVYEKLRSSIKISAEYEAQEYNYLDSTSIKPEWAEEVKKNNLKNF